VERELYYGPIKLDKKINILSRRDNKHMIPVSKIEDLAKLAMIPCVVSSQDMVMATKSSEGPLD
jgi:hypothetical protein